VTDQNDDLKIITMLKIAILTIRSLNLKNLVLRASFDLFYNFSCYF
jgi:hypothetical protein